MPILQVFLSKIKIGCMVEVHRCHWRPSESSHSRTALTYPQTFALERKNKSALWHKHGHFYWTLCSHLSPLCLYVPGFTGTMCQIDIDECASTPCQNGAKCYDRPNGFECRCAEGTYEKRLYAIVVGVLRLQPNVTFQTKKAPRGQMRLDHLLGLSLLVFLGSDVPLDVCWLRRLIWGP